MVPPWSELLRSAPPIAIARKKNSPPAGGAPSTTPSAAPSTAPKSPKKGPFPNSVQVGSPLFRGLSRRRCKTRLSFPKRTDRRTNDGMHDLGGNAQSQAQAGVAGSNHRPLITYGWTGQRSSSGFFDIARPALGVFASSDRF